LYVIWSHAVCPNKLDTNEPNYFLLFLVTNSARLRISHTTHICCASCKLGANVFDFGSFSKSNNQYFLVFLSFNMFSYFVYAKDNL